MFIMRFTRARCWGIGFGVALVPGLVPFGLGAADWPQWRGPQRNGISAETGLLAEWPKEGPRLVWQVKDIGSGYSTPSVVGDRLYLLSNQGRITSSCRRWTPRMASGFGPSGSARSGTRTSSRITRRRGQHRRWMANGSLRSGPTATWPAWSGRPAKCAGRRMCGRITAASRGFGPIPSRRWLTARRWSARRAEAMPRWSR